MFTLVGGGEEGYSERLQFQLSERGNMAKWEAGRGEFPSRRPNWTQSIGVCFLTTEQAKREVEDTVAAVLAVICGNPTTRIPAWIERWVRPKALDRTLRPERTLANASVAC